VVTAENRVKFIATHPCLCHQKYGLPFIKKSLKKGFEKIIVLACYERAQKWLFYNAYKDKSLERKLTYFCMRDLSTRQVVKKLKFVLKSDKTVCKSSIINMTHKLKDSKPGWFPVIDRDRCDNCTECYEFCIFGVFEINRDGYVIVKNPDKCVDNCPACARLCHRAAIIFPKCRERWIAGGKGRRKLITKKDAQKLLHNQFGIDLSSVINIKTGVYSDIQKLIEKFEHTYKPKKNRKKLKKVS
jgi:NAD-dependent dihydropyrimidine dehydrogenase PreA subunit